MRVQVLLGAVSEGNNFGPVAQLGRGGWLRTNLVQVRILPGSLEEMLRQLDWTSTGLRSQRMKVRILLATLFVRVTETIGPVV